MIILCIIIYLTVGALLAAFMFKHSNTSDTGGIIPTMLLWPCALVLMAVFWITGIFQEK